MEKNSYTVMSVDLYLHLICSSYQQRIGNKKNPIIVATRVGFLFITNKQQIKTKRAIEYIHNYLCAAEYTSSSMILRFIFSRRATLGHGDWLLQRHGSQVSRSLATMCPAVPAPTLQVSEIFKSVQGEGPFTGRPSVFLRLGICNLSCAWCDTPYTWLFDKERLEKVQARIARSAKPEFVVPKLYDKSDELRRLNVFDVIEDIADHAGPSVRNIVITGGEPLLHKKPLLHAVHAFIERGFSIEFETNGTISPTGLPSRVHLNVSPKLSNSIQPQNLRINMSVLKECLTFPSSILKFVINDQSDVGEVLDLVKTLKIEAHRVYLMPQGSVR